MAIKFVGEARVVRRFRQSFDRGVVQPEVQHGVHHAGHRGASARSHRDQQWIGRIAKCATGLAAEFGHRRVDLEPKVGRIGFAVGVEVSADLGRNGEARRHGQGERSHLVQVRALAAEKVLHFTPAFGALRAEGIDPLRHSRFPDFKRKARAYSGAGVQPHAEAYPSDPVKQEVDAEQSAKDVHAVERPMAHNDQTEQDGYRGG